MNGGKESGKKRLRIFISYLIDNAVLVTINTFSHRKYRKPQVSLEVVIFGFLK